MDTRKYLLIFTVVLLLSVFACAKYDCDEDDLYGGKTNSGIKLILSAEKNFYKYLFLFEINKNIIFTLTFSNMISNTVSIYTGFLPEVSHGDAMYGSMNEGAIISWGENIIFTITETNGRKDFYVDFYSNENMQYKDDIRDIKGYSAISLKYQMAYVFINAKVPYASCYRIKACYDGNRKKYLAKENTVWCGNLESNEIPMKVVVNDSPLLKRIVLGKPPKYYKVRLKEEKEIKYFCD